MHASIDVLRAPEGNVVWPARRQVLLLLVLAAAALRLHDIAEPSLWRNEIFGLYWIRHSTGFLLTTGLFQETNPPLHFLLLKLWTGLFGTGALSARSLSALASIACVPLIYRLAVELRGPLLGPPLGLVAAGLLALSPVQILLAQEARVYAFLPLFVMAAMLGFCRFAAAIGAGDRRAARRGLALYAGAAVLLLYSHATATLLLAALCGAGLLHLRALRASRLEVAGFLAANLAAGLLAAPVLLAMAAQSFSPNIDWIPPLSSHTPLLISHYLMIGPMIRDDLGLQADTALLFAELGLGLALSLLFLFAGRAVGGQRSLVVVFPLLFLVLACAVSAFRPILEPRVTAWMSVPVSLGLAALLTAPEAGRLRPAAALLLVCGMAIGLADNVVWPAQATPDWRDFVHDVDPTRADGPLLVAAPHAGPLAIGWYAGGPVRTPVRQWVLAPQAAPSGADRMASAVTGAAPIGTEAMLAMVRSGQHLRLFLDTNDIAATAALREGTPEFAAASRQDYPGLLVYSW